ncbi:MAG TPA: hypothetical protein VNM15_09600 [Candidatus Binatia bacterium]|nr:hypothetical protein [Candidatus Binatia bacterium]
MSRMWTKRIAAAIVITAVTSVLVTRLASAQGRAEPSGPAAFDAVRAYLRATHARDWPAVYRFVSSADRRVRDEKTFLRSQEAFDGFAQQLAKAFAASMEVWVIKEKTGPARARIEVGYRIATGDEISSRLMDWNPEKLNALAPPDQTALIAAWDKIKKEGKPVTMEGRETYDLVRESDGWKIFLDWGSQHRVIFRTSGQTPAALAVKFLRNDLLIKSGEPFQIDLRVTNRTDRDVAVKLNHIFEPRGVEKNIDMIACGSLSPLRLRPLATQEMTSVYLLRGAPVKTDSIAIVYDFRLLARKPAAS